MRKIVIAIDGFSACGKSSTAKEVAAQIGYTYIDSGAMYRAVTHYFIDNHINLTNPKDIEKALTKIEVAFIRNNKSGINETYLNGLNVEKKIRTMEISAKVSEVSALVAVRHAMVAQQRRMGKKKAVVMDGRDIGTNVFPQAALKIFMQADFHVRAERRQKELLEKGNMVDLDVIADNLAHRDRLDTSREENPLRKADDAFVIDTTDLTFDEQVAAIIKLANNEIAKEEVL